MPRAPGTIEAIKAYHSESKSLGSGQVLHEAYAPEKAKLVLREMADIFVLDLVEKGLVTDQIVITVGYDIENLSDPERRKQYRGAITTMLMGAKFRLTHMVRTILAATRPQPSLSCKP